MALASAFCCGSPLLADDTGGERIGVTSATAPGGLLEALLFYVVAGSTVVSALAVCFCKNIVRMAVAGRSESSIGWGPNSSNGFGCRRSTRAPTASKLTCVRTSLS